MRETFELGFILHKDDGVRSKALIAMEQTWIFFP